MSGDGRSQPVGTNQDIWLAAAAAFRQAALAQPGVVDIRESAPFHTMGRGRPVRGVSLRPSSAGTVVAHMAVTLDERCVRSRGIAPVLRPLRRRLVKEWDRLGGKRPLELIIEVQDLVEGRVYLKTARSKPDL